MANVKTPQSNPSTAQAVANANADYFRNFKLELNKQEKIVLAGGAPTWTTADTLYTALKA